MTRRWRHVLVLSAGAARRRRAFAGALVCVFGLLAALLIFSTLEPEQRLLAGPPLAVAEITLLFLTVLWVRDGMAPVFDAGSLSMLAIAVYSIFPMLGFIMMHGQWAYYVDGRLLRYDFIPSELGMFGWRYVVYAAAFALTYLVARGRATVRRTAFEMPSRRTIVAILILFGILYSYKLVLRYVYGYSPDSGSYDDLRGALEGLERIPYVVRQIGHNVLSALFVVQLALIILLLARWRQRWCRVLVVIWLAFEVADPIIRLGSRSRAVLLLLSTGILYHRLVKPVSFRLLAVAGGVLLSGFLILGSIRGVRSLEAKARAQNPLTTMNEFQGLFTTAYDLYKRREMDSIPPIPWQLYVSDFYLPIPSQILPFEKMEPSQWYIDLIGQTGSGVGYMFGVMAQASIGLEWIELLLRGAVLALFLAFLHRWYVRRAVRFWPTLFYLFTSIWVYYTFRATTFYFLYFLLYHFVPVMLATKFIAVVASRVRRRRVPDLSAPVTG